MLSPATIKAKIEKSPSGCSDGEGRAVLIRDPDKVVAKDSCETSSHKGTRAVPTVLLTTGFLFIFSFHIITSFPDFNMETRSYSVAQDTFSIETQSYSGYHVGPEHTI